MKGSYLLLIRLAEAQEVSIGSLGTIKFRSGFYSYVGSAMGGFGSRLRRHLRQNKKPHWHIDYLLECASISSIILSPGSKRTECAIAHALLLQFDPVPRFGSSDCHCQSHLFYAPDEAQMRAEIIRAISLLGYPSQLIHCHDAKEFLEKPILWKDMELVGNEKVIETMHGPSG